MKKLYYLNICLCAIMAVSVTAATENEDVASNYNGVWSNGSNQGGGFAAWSITANAGEGGAEYGIWNSTAYGLDLDEAFGLIAYGEGSSVYAKRAFSQAMSAGDVFRFDMAVNTDSGDDGLKGFTLWDSSGNEILTISQGDSDSIMMGDTELLPTYGTETMHWTFTQVSSTEILMYVTGRAGAENYTDVLSFDSSSQIAGITFFAKATPDDEYIYYRALYFNNLSLAQGTSSTTLFSYSIENSRAIITKVSDSAAGNIVVPSKLGGYSIGSVGRSAFKDCTGITGISFADGTTVTNIGATAFQGCTGLTVAALPAGLTAIPDGLFYGCTALQTVVIPDAVTEIGDGAFAECRSLGSVSLPAGVTKMGESVFLNCRGLSGITLSESVAEIPGQFLYECRALSSIEIPGAVTGIDYSAFYNCVGVTKIHFLGNAPALYDDNVFSGTTGKIYYEEGTSGWSSDFGGLTTAVWGSDPDPVEPALGYVWDGSVLTIYYIGTLQISEDLENWETLSTDLDGGTYVIEYPQGQFFFRVKVES